MMNINIKNIQPVHLSRNRGLLKRIIIISLLLLQQWGKAQNSYNLTNGDTLFIYPCQQPEGTLYDDGGAEGEYSSYFNGWAIISVPTGVSIYLSGSYNTEGGYDKITVYDGYGSEGNILLGEASGTGSVNLHSTTGWMSIFFHTDGSVQRDGFQLNWSTGGVGGECINPVTDIAVTSLTTTSAHLSWTAENNAGPFSLSVGSQQYILDTNFIDLTGLNPNSHYDIIVASTDDATLPCCMAVGSFRTICGVMTAPVVENFDDHGTGIDILPSCWARQKNYDDPELRYPQLVSSQYYSAPASLMLFCGSNSTEGHWALAIGPEISDDISTLFARMHLRSTNAGARIEIGVCSDTTLYGNNFIPIDTLTVTASNIWEEKVLSLSGYSGTGNRIALRMMRSLQPGNLVTVWVDNLILEPCGVWHISREQRGVSDFYVEWETIGYPSVDVELGPLGFAPGSGTTYQDVTSPCHFTGLEPGHDYLLRFYTTCGTVTRQQATLTASTLSDQGMALDFCEGFDNSGDLLPSGWRRLDTYNNTPRPYTYSSFSGSRGLFFHHGYYYGIHPIAVLPRIDTIPLDQLTLSLMLRSDGYNSGYIEVGVMEYPEYAASFIPIDTLYASTSWTFHKLNIGHRLQLTNHDTPFTGHYIALRAYDPYHTYNYIYVDDIKLSPCLVSGGEVTNIASHRVELRWDALDTCYHGDSISIEYGGAGFIPGEGIMLNLPVSGPDAQFVGAKQRVAIYGLEADSLYHFYLYGQCQNVSTSCAQPLMARTLEADLPLPYCQQFEGVAPGTLPSGWTAAATYNGYPAISDSYSLSGSRSIRLSAYGSSNFGHSLAVMPMLDVESLRELIVSFSSISDNRYYSPVIEVGVMDNPTDESTFTTVYTVIPSCDTWTRHNVSLQDYTGTGNYISFRYYHNGCNYCTYSAYIDDLTVSDATSANISLCSVNSHGATIHWDTLGRSYNGAVIQWGPSGYQFGAGHCDTVATGIRSYTLDTLEPGTDYDLFVTALSATGINLCDFQRISFSTAGEPFQSSWCYSFEDVMNGNYPPFWSRPLTYDNTPQVSNSYAHSGSNSLYMRAYNCSENIYQCLAVMPLLEEEDLSGLTLRFLAIGGNGYIHVGMMSDPNDPATFDTLQSFTHTSEWYNWQSLAVNLDTYTGTARHIALLFSVPSCYNETLYIDDLSITRCSIINVQSYSSTTSSFTVSWSTTGATDSIDIEYGPHDFSPGTGTVITNITSPQVITGLDAATTYDFRLVSHCSGSNSTCSESHHTATTLPIPLVDGFCEDFSEYLDNTRPMNWSIIHGYSSYPCVISDATNIHLDFYCDPNGENLIAMPASEEEPQSLLLTFNIRCDNEDNPQRPSLIVGAMTHPLEGSSFTPIDTIHPTYFFRPVTVDLSNYSGTGRHIAFRYLDDGYRHTFIDDIALSHCRITNLTVQRVTDTSVTLSWSNSGSFDSVYIAYDTLYDDNNIGNFTPTMSTFNSQLSTLNSLLPNHTYLFRLWASFQDTSLSCQAATITASTLIEPTRIPYCEGFEGFEDNTTPQGWSFPYPLPYMNICSSAHTGQHSLRLPARGGDYPSISYATLPFITDNNADVLWFDGWAFAEQCAATLTIGVMSDPSDTTSFDSVQSIHLPAYSWQHIKIPITSSYFSTNNPHIAIRLTNNAESVCFTYLDDVNIRSCELSSASTVSATENTITLDWSYGDDTGRQVYVEFKATGHGAADFNPGEGTMMLIDHSPFIVNGLEEATWYTFHFYPVCDSIFDGCNHEISMRQTLHPWVSLPYCENFESIPNALPNNWVNLSSSDNPERNYTSVGHNDSESYYTRLIASTTDSSLFVLPRIYEGSTCPVLDHIYANFWTFFGGDAEGALLEVGVMSDANDPSTFIPHDTVSPNTDSWKHNIKTINNYNTLTSYVAFRLRSLDGNLVYCDFDDLCMEKCVAAEVSVSDITQNSATIAWDNYSVDTLVCEYGPRGFELGNGTVIKITESPYFLGGLADGTDYEFTFATMCGCNLYGTAYRPGNGSWGYNGGWGGGGWGWYCCVPCHYDTSINCNYWRWGPWQGHSWAWWYTHHSDEEPWVTPPIIDITTQAAILETPYCESFESFDSLLFPPSWRREQDKLYPDLVTMNNHSGRRSLRFYTTPGGVAYASLPPLEMGEPQEMVLTFYAYSTNSDATTDYFYIGVMSNPDNIATFVKVDSLELSQIKQWEQKVVPLSAYNGEGQYIALLFSPTSNAYNYFVDDLYLARCAISNVALTDNNGEVTITWTSHNAPDRVLIEYGPQGTTPDDTSADFHSLTAYSSPATFSVNADSSYDVYVSAICSDTATGSCHTEPLTVNPRLMIPFCETFDGYPNEVCPDGWKVVQRNIGMPEYPYTETQYDDHQVLAFYPGTGTNNIVTLLRPLPLGDSLAGKWLHVGMASQYSSNIYLDFGYLADTTAASTFVQMGSIHNSMGDVLESMNCQLAEVPGHPNGNRLALRASSSSGDRWIRLDKIAVSNNPYPTHISSTAHGAARRELRWTGGLTHYTISYGYGGSWNEVESDSCRATLTGLTADKDYEVFFTAPDGERLCLPYEFHTPASLALPHCEDFESHERYSIPEGWARYHSGGSNYPRVEENVWQVSGTKSLQFHNNNSNQHFCSATLPDIDIDSTGHASLLLKMRGDYDYANYLIVGVQETQDDISSFEPIDTLYPSTSWRSHNVALGSYLGGGRYITLRYITTNHNANYLYVDDLSIQPCALPDLRVSGATTITATMPEGAAGAVDYWIAYSDSLFSLVGTGLRPSWQHITTNPYEIGGLTPATTYHILSVCDTTNSSCSQGVTLTTAEQVSLPHCEDFSGYPSGSMAEGWQAIRMGNTPEPYVNGSEELFFGNNCNTVNRDYAIMPDMEIDSLRHAEIRFDLWSKYHTTEFLAVGVMSDPWDISTFVAIDTLQCTASEVWQEQHVSLGGYEGGGRYLAFCAWRNGSCMYLYMDNLRITGCRLPETQLIGGSTVRFEMEGHTPPPYGSSSPNLGEELTVDYWIEYGPEGFSQLDTDTLWNDDSTAFTLEPRNTIVHVTENPFLLSTLDEETTYDFYARCDSASVSCFPPSRITTSRTLSLPLCYHFSDYPYYDLPSLWRSFNNNISYYRDYPYIYADYVEFYSEHYYNICQATLPDLDIDSLKGISLHFQMWVDNNSTGLIVGVMDNSYDVASFTPVDTVFCHSGSTWESKGASLSNYGGNGRFLALREMATMNYKPLRIRDLYIESCPQPTAALVGGTTMRFVVGKGDSWETGGSGSAGSAEADYWIEYGPEGFEQLEADTIWNDDSTAFSLQPQGSIVHVTESPFFISDLEPGVTYDFYARCDSGMATCRPPIRRTMSDILPIASCFYFNNYDYYSIPTFWSRWSNDYYSGYPQVNDYYLEFYQYYPNSITQAMLPDLDIDSIRHLFLSFSIYGNYPGDGIIVGVLEDRDEPSSFVAVDTLYITTSNSWEEVKPRLERYMRGGRWVALRELSQGYYRSVRVRDLLVESCGIPKDVKASLHGSNIVRIDAEGYASSGEAGGSEEQFTSFYVEYDTAGFSQGSGSFLLIDHLPFDITLDYNMGYDFYFRCDTLRESATCRGTQRVVTQPAPTPLPYCEGFEESGDYGMPTAWSVWSESSYSNVWVHNDAGHTGTRDLYFVCYHNYRNYAILPDLTCDSLQEVAISLWLSGPEEASISVGAMSDPEEVSSFIPVRTLACEGSGNYVRHIVTLNSLPGDARFLALRTNTPDDWNWRYISVDDIYIDTVGAMDFRIVGVESDEVTFEWNQVGWPTMEIEYGPLGFTPGSGTVVSVSSHPFTLTGLDPLTDYRFYFRSTSQENVEGACNTNYEDSATIFTPAGGTGCIDPTNLSAGYTTCFYGSYGNPYANTGMVNYGSGDIRSRHTVHYDPLATDPRTGGLLRMVPEGAMASVRLGNWNSNTNEAEGEALTYSLLVDTGAFDLLILKYAAVLQDPLHAPSDQPRFSLEILDEWGNLLDAQCAAADFIANRNLGWNEAADNVLWKDWTTVGVDMSPYADQPVFIRLTTRDCGEGSHFGYAYFTLECMKKNMRSELCGDVDSNTFFAPAGFAYSWYSSENSGDTISRSQSIRVATDTLTYFCRCAFVDDESCSFTISAFAGTRYPLASFTHAATLGDCKFTVAFTNTSTISADGMTPIGTGEPCETALWDFGDGQGSTNYNVTHTYDHPGTYMVTLVSGIAGNMCTDTAMMTITLTLPGRSHNLSGNTVICHGDTVTLTLTGAEQFEWGDGTTDEAARTFVPDSSVTFMVSITDSNGCRDTLRHHVEVMQTTYTHLYDTIVENQMPYTWNGVTFDLADTALTGGQEAIISTFNFQLSTFSHLGCDSIVVMHLSVFHNVAATADSTVCQSALPLVWDNCIFTLPDTIDGSGFSISQTDTIATVNGADSVISKTLTVIPTTHGTVDTAIVENLLPLVWNGTAINLTDTALTGGQEAIISTFNFQLLTINYLGCDSIVSLNLTVFRNVYDTIDSAVCQSALPIVWNGITFNLPDTAFESENGSTVSTFNTQHSTQNGADSVVTMRLTIWPTFQSRDTTEICQNSLPFVWHTATFDSLITEGDYILFFKSSHGCDSTLLLHLNIDTNTHAHLYDTVVENQMPYNWDGITFNLADTAFESENGAAVSTFNSQLSTLNHKGCDSTITMTLTVFMNVFDTIDSAVCQSALPIEWNGITFDLPDTAFESENGSTVSTFNSQLSTQNGADSLVTLRLTVLPTTYYYDTLTVCRNSLPLEWQDSLILVPDSISALNYQFSTINSYGCDSLMSLNLTVAEPYFSHDTAAVCASTTLYGWLDTLVAVDYISGEEVAADSTLSLVLHRTTTEECDSNHYLSLTIHAAYLLDDSVSICQNSLPYTWRDTIIDLPDTLSADEQEAMVSTFNYQLSTINSYGCDSLMSLNLTVAEPYFSHDTAAVCASTTLYGWLDTLVAVDYISGEEVAADSTLSLVLHRTTTEGCDSNHYLSLTIHAAYLLDDSVSICQNSLPYTWRDTIIDLPDTLSAGEQVAMVSTFNSQLSTQNGCDSTMRLTLTVNPNTQSHLFDTIVENQLPYIIGDTLINIPDSAFASGNDSIISTLNSQLSISNYLGCDSIIHLTLTVFRNVTVNIDSSVCLDALPIVWNGITFDLPDTAFESENGAIISTHNSQFSTQNGADSIINMTLTVYPTHHTDESIQICRDALPYSWHGTIIDVPDTLSAGEQEAMVSTFNSQLSTQNGCDSSFSLSLTVNEVYHTTDSVESCHPYTWIDGTTYSNSTSTPQVVLLSDAGCDSTVTLDFTIFASSYTYLTDSFCTGSAYTFHGRDYTHSGVYADTLQNIDGCDSIVTLTLTCLTRPTIDISADPDCYTLTYTVTASSSVDYLHWEHPNAAWSPDWGSQNSSRIFFRPITPTTLHLLADYYPTPTCPNSDSITLSPIVQPLAQMQVSPEFLTYDQPTLEAFDRSVGAIGHQWFIDGFYYGGGTQITYTPDAMSDSVVILLAVSSEQCTDSVIQIVPIHCHTIYTPNAFTPDESTNNYFVVKMDGIVEYEITIYSRQGLLVFESKDPTIPWDGTYKGKPCPQGNYVWFIKYTTTESPRIYQHQKGSVLLLR